MPVSDVRNVIIWGNHSSSQYPDVNHGTVTRADGLTLPIRTAVCDDAWLQGEFVSTVQQRGAAIIAARKLSSALSAASSTCDPPHDALDVTDTSSPAPLCIDV
jgi:malate dehydrogenase